MKISRVKGTRDFYPEEMVRRRWLEDLWRKVSMRNGFVEYDGPILEHLDLLTAKSGQEIVEQLFSLTDRGGRDLAIRPEITPTLARMVNERAASLPKPIRWFSIPRLCRGEQPQRGRLREFFQWNIDIIGVASPVADAEAIFAAIDFLREIGLGPNDVVMRISSRAMLAELLKQEGFSDEQMIDSAYRLLDKRSKSAEDVFESLVKEVFTDAHLRESLARIGNYRTLGEIQAQPGLSKQAREACEDLAEVFKALEALGVDDYCTFDIGIVRGLAYYTGTVFEAFDRAGQFRAICGGGRFDDLLSALGGPSMPAVGFGMGDVVLGEVLAEKGLLPKAKPVLDYYVIAADKSLSEKVLRVTAELRAKGYSARFSYRQSGLGKQLKAAGACGALKVVILGQETTDDGLVTVKDMVAGSQIRLPLEKLLSEAERSGES